MLSAHETCASISIKEVTLHCECRSSSNPPPLPTHTHIQIRKNYGIINFRELTEAYYYSKERKPFSLYVTLCWYSLPLKVWRTLWLDLSSDYFSRLLKSLPEKKIFRRPLKGPNVPLPSSKSKSSGVISPPSLEIIGWIVYKCDITDDGVTQTIVSLSSTLVECAVSLNIIIKSRFVAIRISVAE